MMKQWRIRYVNANGASGYGPWVDSKSKAKKVKRYLDKEYPQNKHFIEKDFDSLLDKLGISLVFVIFVILALIMFIARACHADQDRMRYEITVFSLDIKEPNDARIGITYVDSDGELIKESRPIEIKNGKKEKIIIEHFAYLKKKRLKWYIFVFNQSLTPQMKIEVKVYKNGKLITGASATEKEVVDYDDFQPANIELGSEIK